MDLANIEHYICPLNIQNITNWSEDWAWLAGGTWLFSEPQPHLKVLVDMQSLGWSEIAVQADNLLIGATCPLIKLWEYHWLPEWKAAAAFKSAISTISASFKVINMATVGGNICLALAIGNLAPVMVALNATYEIWKSQGDVRLVAAKDFQLGTKITVLQPGEVLRRIIIPLNHLKWQVNYQRFGIAATDPALAIVVSAYNPRDSQLRLVLGASVAAPYLITLNRDLETENFAFLQNINFINDARGSAAYRREITQVLIKRCLADLLWNNP
ncbi:MAG: FAD binding domain-containing protein [Nostocaceae cyanobacterium]|nr:FAD binding domain-containing protein [Nostocaceae cyanobacterium]